MNFNELADKLDKVKDDQTKLKSYFTSESGAQFAQAKHYINQYVTAKGAPLLVGLLGYTPGFNDGDPCYHSCYPVESWSSHSVPDEWLTNEEGDVRDVEDLIADQDEAYGEDFIGIVTDLIEWFEEHITSLTKEGTNFVYMFYFDGKGNVFEREDDYDCGW